MLDNDPNLTIAHPTMLENWTSPENANNPMLKIYGNYPGYKFQTQKMENKQTMFTFYNLIRKITIINS